MLGDWQNAYRNQLEYIRYKDSIFNQQKEQALMEVETRYQTAEKERKIQEQKVDLLSKEQKLNTFRNSRNILLLLLLVLIVAAIFFVYRYRARKKINLLLDDKNKQLEDINAYKDKLFAIISHDLRSPISSFSRITSSLSMAIDHLKPEEIKRYLIEIDKTASNLHLMLRGLLQWSLSQQGGMNLNLEKCDVAECINNALDDCRSTASEKQIEILFHTNSGVFVIADTNLLHIVLRNLMSNALKFTLENLTISIEVNAQQNSVYIDITDQGPGVPDNVKSGLFQRIASDAVGNSAKGTGFGLFISSELMLKMNGEISLLESSEKGSTFRLSLPLHKDS
jgi:signal transduction histidine kinase